MVSSNDRQPDPLFLKIQSAAMISAHDHNQDMLGIAIINERLNEVNQLYEKNNLLVVLL